MWTSGERGREYSVEHLSLLGEEEEEERKGRKVASRLSGTVHLGHIRSRSNPVGITYDPLEH